MLLKVVPDLNYVEQNLTVSETGFARTATIPALECHFLNSLDPHCMQRNTQNIDGLRFYLLFIPALGALLTIRGCIPLFMKRGRGD